MNYKIKEKKDLTSSKGNAFAIATLVDETGAEFENTTLFSPINAKAVGEMIEGELAVNDYNGKKGWKFSVATAAPRWATKKPDIAKAMEKKEASIEKFQTNKESSIEKMACFRDSTLATNLYFDKQGLPFTVEEYIKKWEQFRAALENKLTIPF